MRRADALTIAGVGLALLVIWPLQRSIDGTRAPVASSFVFTPDRRLMKVAACGHGPTLADLVWVQSMGYVLNEFKNGRVHMQHLYARFDTMTELDPHFVDAYVMGAVFLSAIAQEPERSLDLIRKGEGTIDTTGEIAVEKTGGTVYAGHPERWRLLNEHAATHLVTLAGFATTIEERTLELRTAGKLYSFGIGRYPRDRYPSRPPFFEWVGPALVKKRADARDWQVFRRAARTVWQARTTIAPKGSAFETVVQRRLAELDARDALEQIEGSLARYSSRHLFNAIPLRLEGLARPFGDLPRLPRDPLGVGFFLLDGRVVAPALDALVQERLITRKVAERRLVDGRPPERLESLGVPPPPPWVDVAYDPATGEVRATGRPPVVVQSPGTR